MRDGRIAVCGNSVGLSAGESGLGRLLSDGGKGEFRAEGIVGTAEGTEYSKGWLSDRCLSLSKVG
jgi:hypothetical protein